MKKLSKRFEFQFPLTHKIVRNLRIVNEHVGNLAVEGVVCFDPSVSVLSHLEERYVLDIDFVKWNGTDIKPVLELTSLMDDIHEATLRYCAGLFEENLQKAA